MFSILSQEEKEILDAWMTGYMDVYELTSVTPQRGFRMKSLIVEEEIDVVDTKGSQNLVRWDIILARVYRHGGINKISGVGEVLPRKRKDGLILYLSCKALFRSPSRGKSDHAYRRTPQGDYLKGYL